MSDTEREIPAEYVPTADQRALVENAAAFGLTQADSAEQLKIDEKTLRKHFRDELSSGKFKVDMTAGNVKKVWLLARRGSLEATMSYYLVERIKAQPNIEVLTRSEVTALEGCDGNLETARWRHCGRPKAAAFSTSARWSAVGTYSAGISRSVSLNSGTRAREADKRGADCRTEFRDKHYACFHTGPSATADIEGVLIHGAQGVRSLSVLPIARAAGDPTH